MNSIISILILVFGVSLMASASVGIQVSDNGYAPNSEASYAAADLGVQDNGYDPNSAEAKEDFKKAGEVQQDPSVEGKIDKIVDKYRKEKGLKPVERH